MTVRSSYNNESEKRIMAKKTPIEMIRILPDEQFEIAKKFINLGEKLNCKFQVRFAPAHKSWKCVISRKRPARVLYTVECKEDRWHIKACLWNINAYNTILSNCSVIIKNIIKTAYDCKLCNTHCNGGAGFTFENVNYRKCVGCCFYFSNLNQGEWSSLIQLIENEYKATSPA
jgi:hypothetical protein